MMFRKLAVSTVVLVAVLVNDALALPQGNPFTPTTTSGDQKDDSYTFPTKTPMATPSTTTTTPPALPATPADMTPAHEETMPTGATPLAPGTDIPTTPAGTQPLPVTPSANTPTVEKSSHVSDCDPNYPSEKPDETRDATTPTTSNVTPAASTPAVVTPPTPSTEKPTDQSVVTPVSPPNVVDSKTVSGNSEQTSQQANTQSGNQNDRSSTGTGAFAIVGVIVAVAAVGAAVSQVKKIRDADTDAALVTPGEHENIHIEIKSTPAGGSTIL